MKVYTKGMIGKRFKINYKAIDEWTEKLHKEYGSARRYGIVPVPKDPFGRYGWPEYVVDHYPNVPKQPVLYLIQSARPEDISFFIQQANLKLKLEIIKIHPRTMQRDLIRVWQSLESGKSIAVDTNELIESQKREIVLGAIERGASEIIVQIKGHWDPEPYNTIEYDTAGNDDLFFEKLQKKLTRLKS